MLTIETKLKAAIIIKTKTKLLIYSLFYPMVFFAIKKKNSMQCSV